jgi:hypothetical protein
MKEIAGANLTGGVAVTGTLREIKGDELEQARKNDSSMSSFLFHCYEHLLYDYIMAKL